MGRRRSAPPMRAALLLALLAPLAAADPLVFHRPPDCDPALVTVEAEVAFVEATVRAAPTEPRPDPRCRATPVTPLASSPGATVLS